MTARKADGIGGLGAGEEAVADAAYGDEVVGVRGIIFDVTPQADDEVVDGAGISVFVDAPDLFKNLLAGDDLAFAFGEVAKEVGLHEREMCDAVWRDEFESIEADGAVVEDILISLTRESRWRGLRSCGVLPGGTAEKGFDADEEDVEVEGFGEVVVGSGFNAFENLFWAGARGEHKYRCVMLGFAEGADDGETVCAREHAVEDYGGDVFFGGEEVGEGGVAVGLVMGSVAFGLQVEQEALGEVLFVFDEDDQWDSGFGHGIFCLLRKTFVTLIVTYQFNAARQFLADR
jgi:hypothetical protein